MPVPVAAKSEKEEQTLAGKPEAPAGRGSAPAKFGFFKTALQTLVWLLLAILSIEAVFAMAGIGEEEIFAFDKVLGTKHMTNKSITWRKEGFSRSYFDGAGLREPHLKKEKAPGIYRIALLGDSMVEGLQVPIEDTFGRLLGKRLNEKLKQAPRPGITGVQVLNFGTSGYSTVQELLQLEKQVLDYQPDLVIVGYNSRDIFENWAAPDEVLANVRPLALKIPGKELVVESGSVTCWMRTPRAKILSALSFIRNHSRIWGVISYYENEASFHNPFYKLVLKFINQPGKTLRTMVQDIGKDFGKAKPLPTTTPTIAPTAVAATPVVTPAQKVPETAAKTEQSQDKPAQRVPVDKGAEKFIALMKDTLEAIYLRMDRDLQARGGRLMVLVLPSRATLSPIGGMDKPLFNVDYKGEVQIVKEICRKNHIACVDALTPATAFSLDKQCDLFYAAHLTRGGHKYVENLLAAPVTQIVEEKRN